MTKYFCDNCFSTEFNPKEKCGCGSGMWLKMWEESEKNDITIDKIIKNLEDSTKELKEVSDMKYCSKYKSLMESATLGIGDALADLKKLQRIN